MPKSGKQRKRPAPFPPTESEGPSHSNGQISVGCQTQAPVPPIIRILNPKTVEELLQTKHKGFGNVQDGPPRTFGQGKASFPEKPPQEMALAPEPALKRFCPSTSISPADYASGASYAKLAANVMPGNESLFQSNVSGFRVIHGNSDNQNQTSVEETEKTDTSDEEGWLSYFWSFLPFS